MSINHVSYQVTCIAEIIILWETFCISMFLDIKNLNCTCDFCISKTFIASVFLGVENTPCLAVSDAQKT